MKNSIILIDKPVGWTSFDVCAKIRGQLKAMYRARGETATKRQLKVGHAGTLDPFATGLLIVLLGDATKQADTFLKQDKVYEATIFLGQRSSTGDPEGELTSGSSAKPTVQEIELALQKFRGVVNQKPPAFSAIKIDGKRAYQLARQGKIVDMPSRQVEIFKLEMLSYQYPAVHIRAHVSSGTYIRTLAEDIGEALGTGAYCSQLRRTRSGNHTVADAVIMTKNGVAENHLAAIL